MDEMHQILRRVIADKQRFRLGRSREEFIGWIVSQIYAYGGDTTWQLIGHYGDRLKEEVGKIVPE